MLSSSTLIFDLLKNIKLFGKVFSIKRLRDLSRIVVRNSKKHF
jgi:hypothetical protein